MSRNLWFPEKNRQENFSPAFPPVNALKKEFAQNATGITFSRIAPLSQFIPPSCLLQTLAFRTGTQRSLWLTYLAFFISLHLLQLQNPVSVRWFHQNKSVSMQIGAMQIGERGIWAWSLIYHFICGRKPYGLIWVLRSTATGININRSRLKEGSWVADRFLK